MKSSESDTNTQTHQFQYKLWHHKWLCPIKIASSAWKKFFFIDCLGRRSSSVATGAGSNSECRHVSEGKNGSMSSSINADCCFPCCCCCCKSSSRKVKYKSSVNLPISKDMSAAAARRRSEFTSRHHHHHQQHHHHNQQHKTKGRAQMAVQSPLNQALERTDPLFHLYLICVFLITLSILGIKALIQVSNGMTIFDHTWIGFGFLLLIILGSNFYTLVISNKVSLMKE